MTRQERQKKIESAFPYEPITSDKEDITRVLDDKTKQWPIVQTLGVLIFIASVAAYIYKNYFQ